MRTGQTTILAAVLAVVTAFMAMAGVIVLNTGARLGAGPFVLGFSQGYDEAAYRLLLDAPTSAEIAVADDKARQALALAPYENTARLRLAYIDVLKHGHLTAAGAKHFALSYDLMPADHNVAAWRIRFGLEHWASLTPEARAAVFGEVRTFARLGSREVNVREILSSIRDPRGRLTAALWLRSLALSSSY